MNTHATNLQLVPYNPEIERTFHRLRREAAKRAESRKETESDTDSTSSEEEEKMARPENRTLKQLTTPNLTQQPLCITFPDLDEGATFELKSGLIHLLPSFHGLGGEDPNKHLSEFHVVCTGMKPNGVTDDQLKLRAFPFSLKDAAKDWLYYLPSGSITTWTAMKKCFLEKFFPASKLSHMKKQISNVEQDDGENLYDYWERFKKLCASCPYHGYSDHDLIMYFCGGLSVEDGRMVHSASGGGIVNKTPTEANELISELAESSRHFTRRPAGRKVYAASSNSGLEEQVSNLTSMVQQLVMGSRQQVMACGICSSPGHTSEVCPAMREEVEDVNAVGQFGPPRQKYDPYSNTFNPGWRDHPNLRYGNQQGGQQFGHNNQFNQDNQFGQNNQFRQNNQFGQPRQQFYSKPSGQPTGQPSGSNNQPPGPNASMSTDEMIRALVTNVSSFQHETKSCIKNMEQQISQMATAINKLEARDSNKLPPSTEVNPKDLCAVSLRNGRQLEEVEKKKAKAKETTIHEEEELVVEKEAETVSKSPENQPDITPLPVYEPEVPFPEALKRTKRPEHDKDIYETFRKCEVNMPLLDLLKSVPKYAKFLKELCTVKRNNRIKSAKKARVSEQVSAMV
ncbi:hypothetical protein RND81_06G091200 [Saponaria officinalis]|uniref:Retrotransposon gag domain-containing protein n=1 Tax=Saponaria officinalis TaxID=3572 RepID=A0AAW1KAW1_SAPOF